MKDEEAWLTEEPASTLRMATIGLVLAALLVVPAGAAAQSLPNPYYPHRRVAPPAAEHMNGGKWGETIGRRPRRGRQHLGLPPLLQQPAARRRHLRRPGRRPAGGEVQPRRRAPRQLGGGRVRGPARLPHRPGGQPLGDRLQRERHRARDAGRRPRAPGLQVQPERRDPDDAGQGGRRGQRAGHLRPAERRGGQRRRRHLRHRRPRAEQPRGEVRPGPASSS